MSHHYPKNNRIFRRGYQYLSVCPRRWDLGGHGNIIVSQKMGPWRAWQYQSVCPSVWDLGGHGNISQCVLVYGTWEGMAISVSVS